MTDDRQPEPSADDEETLLHRPEPAAEPSSGGGSLGGGRFAPGAMLEARYRIVALLGRGGMGEVYRAEDLKLGETVALKFLPAALARDGAALARLHREVRLARRITHKNVVRVHDVGEAEGTTFLAMEYIDGENLASLLRRIGRLPEAKALELARQLCAGLAAAHDVGMVHRDLKPANVMIDGEGSAKISDFGLAGLAGELERPELAGTPLYMAPEQLAEGKASFASDVYALGLVLYEMFSGARPFRSTIRAELLAEHRASDPPSLSSSVDRIDPLVESAVAACLRRDPSLRPDSPLAVASALPGGDPLAAALAAGETPSPEMVARAAGQAALSKPLAGALLAVTFAATLGASWLLGQRSVVGLDRPLEPAVLAHRAREILTAVGAEVEHTRSWFQYDEYRRVVSFPKKLSLAEWRVEAARRPTVLEFVLRGGDRPIAPEKRWSVRVTLDDPPPATPGVSTVRLDSRGRLRALLLAPTPSVSAAAAREREAASGVTAPGAGKEWVPLFEAAGLDLGDFAPATPERAPPFWAEKLLSWEGAYPGQASPRVLVDAATTAGSVVWWQLTEALLVEAPPPKARPTRLLGLVVFALMLLLGGWLARRHLESGRGDRRGAARLAMTVGGANLAAWGVLGDHLPGLEELTLVNAAIAQAALIALGLWLLYMALEPYARRLMPRRLTSWTRLLEGGFNDPLVGRDLLIGLTVSSAVLVAMGMAKMLDPKAVWSYPHLLRPLYGPAAVALNTVSMMIVLVPISLMAIIVVARGVVRSDRWAPAAAFAVILAINALDGGVTLDSILRSVMLTALGAYVGLLALVGFAAVTINLRLVPISLDPSLWWAPASWIGIGAVLLLALWCYRAATRPG